jgi:hypothetical protein
VLDWAKTELKWFGIGFGIPFLLLIAADLLLRRTNLTVWERITRPEDVCSYGSCVVLPAVAYSAMLVIRIAARR